MTEAMTGLTGMIKRRSRLVMIGVAAIAALTLAFVLAGGREAAPDASAYFRVTRGPLTISITEAGTIKPREQEIIKNDLEGRTTILYLIPEGTHVKKGDLLVELDSSTLLDNKLDQEIRVMNVESSFIQSRENLEVVRNQAQSDIDKAELDFSFAKEDLAQYEHGEYPNMLKEREAAITLAQEELQRVDEKLKWSKVLFDEKYISESELQADELQVKKARLNLDLARNELNLLTRYRHPRRIAELESNVKQSEMSLDRVRIRSAANVIQAEADLRAKESELGRQRDRLRKIEEQIDKASIVAPRDGLVIYSTSTQVSWRGNVEPLAEGQQVRERQELIYLPTTSDYNAEIAVHESNMDRIRVGLPARIVTDALPGREFSGTVRQIAPLPDASSVFMNPDLKIYKTDVSIKGGEDLRAGMSCRVEILVDHYPSAVFVPVQCVIRIDGRPAVFVGSGGKNVPREVKLGLDNNRMAHILEGIEEGDMVLMTPPLDKAEAPRETVTRIENAAEGEEMNAGRDAAPGTGPPARVMEPRESGTSHGGPQGRRSQREVAQ